MTKTKFGVSIDDEIVREIDELVDECAVLTAYLEPDVDHGPRVRELILRRRKGTL
jgi:hypothetical protein